MAAELLRVDGLSKRFGPTVALDDVSLGVPAGAGLAVVGENGAGKSTLMKVLAGAYQADSGTITLRGEPFQPRRPADSTAAGIVTVYQEPVFLAALSVTENIFAGQELRGRFGGLRWDAMRRRARELVTRFGLEADIVDREMQELTVAQQQLTLIARAFNHAADLLILDEPTSALSDVEADRLFESVRSWQEGGGTVLYITHRLRELPEVCQQVVVLRDGALVGQHDIAGDFDAARREIVAQMSRREGDDEDSGAPAQAREPQGQGRSSSVSDTMPRLAVEGLTRDGEFADVDLAVRPGEVRGLYGLVGAGRTELALTVYGERRPERGRMLIDGEEVVVSSPRDAKRKGIMYLPEDRGRDGLYGFLSVRSNFSSAVLEQLRAFGPVLDFKRERALARDAIDDLSIRTRSPEANVLTLSGGSQQKVLLGRTLSVEPRILLLDEPTRGVDVATKQEFYGRIRSLAAEGLAVLVVSSELNDLLEVADVIDVMRLGTIVDTVELTETDRSGRIVAAAIGSDHQQAAAPVGEGGHEEVS